MTRTLEVVYVVPSHYDADGYVYRFVRGVVPSNTLMCLASLTRTLGHERALGSDVNVRVTTYDDTIDRIPVERIARMARRRNTSVLVGFVGVQTNQFARATDLALALRREGVQVVIGGFHVSGTLALIGREDPGLRTLLDAGVTLFKGEAESPGVLASMLRDALEGELRPVYEAVEPPDLDRTPIPEVDVKYLRRFVSRLATLDTSRGCPYGCSFCTIINVQGRKMRCRPAEAVLHRIRENYRQGVDLYFFTDDNFSRSDGWAEIFDGLAAMRGEGLDVHFMMQIDTRAAAIPGFVEKASEAGCRMVFIGMESVNPRNIEAMGKNQNDPDDYRDMVAVWRDAGILVHVGYIVGMPYDTPEEVRADVALLRDHIQVHEASFFMLTPLPGSQDHADMVRNGVAIDPDPNLYDSAHETFIHPNMAPGEWQAAYDGAYEMMYSKENIISILLRTPRQWYWHMFWTCVWYRYSGVFARMHPMATGLLRLKDRRSRRAGFPVEGRLAYARRRVGDSWRGLKVYVQLLCEFQEVWMITRQTDDPRWEVLADLRGRWAAVQGRLAESRLAGRCDEAAQEVRALLATAAQRFTEMSHDTRVHGTRARARLTEKAREVKAYLRKFELQAPTFPALVSAQQYVSEGLLQRYEELAIGYVACRRRCNRWRERLFFDLKRGRLLTGNVLRAPFWVMGEAYLNFRFWFRALHPES
jgi:hypothetical protein